MSDSAWPHRRQPTRLPRPWDSPGKNTGVGCHFLLQSVKVKSESEVTQSCPTLSDPMDCSLPGCSVHGIFQAKEYWSGVPLPSLYHGIQGQFTFPSPYTSLLPYPSDTPVLYNIHYSHFPSIPFIHSINKHHLYARHCSKHWGYCSEQNKVSALMGLHPSGSRQIKNKYKKKKQIYNRWSGGKCYGERDLARKAVQSNTTNSMICTLKTSNPHVFKNNHTSISLNLFTFQFYFKNITPWIILRGTVISSH